MSRNEPDSRAAPFGIKLAWFVGLWLAGVAALAAIALAIRAVLEL